MWFFIALIGYLLLAVVAILDKLILTKSISKPVVYTFYSTVVMFLAFLVWPFGGGLLNGWDWWWAIISGLAFGFGLWTFYVALKAGEATHITPFNGAIISIVVYILSASFLAEALTMIQVLGIIILSVASLLLSWEKSIKHHGLHWGFFWAMLSGIFFAISHVTAKYLYEIYPFWTGFMWTRATTGLLALPLLFVPTVLNSFKKITQPTKAKIKKKKSAQLLFIIKQFLGILSIVFIQYAAATGMVSVVFALAGVQYVLMFIIIYLFTRLAPKIFKEYFTKREIAVEVVALWLVVVGSMLFVL